MVTFPSIDSTLPIAKPITKAYVETLKKKQGLPIKGFDK